MPDTLDYYDILYDTPDRFPVLEPLPEFTGPVLICGENLLGGSAIMATAGEVEPTHACEECNEPLWALDDPEVFASCPYCGEEASRISYCRTCDRPSCRNTGH